MDADADAGGSDVDALLAPNRGCIASVQAGDVRRFEEILAVDVLCSNPDASLVDRGAFPRRTARPVTIRGLEAEDVKVRVLGDGALHPRADRLRRHRTRTPPRPLHRRMGAPRRQAARGAGARHAVAAAALSPSSPTPARPAASS